MSSLPETEAAIETMQQQTANGKQKTANCKLQAATAAASASATTFILVYLT